MRVFVFTYDRYETITTTRLLDAEQIDYTALCHTDEQRARYIAAGTVRPEVLVATGNPRGLAYNRNAALDMMETGEWAVFLVDDMLRIEELDEYDQAKGAGTVDITTRNVSRWNAKFKRQVTLGHFLGRCAEHRRYAERMGANLVGFAAFENPLFRTRRWKINAFADGRAWLIRKTHLRFDENVQMIEDIGWTAQNLREFGAVLVDAWILPKCRRYSAGAFGSMEERLPQKIREVDYLVRTYPDLIAVRKKAGQPDGSHAVIRARS